MQWCVLRVGPLSVGASELAVKPGSWLSEEVLYQN